MKHGWRYYEHISSVGGLLYQNSLYEVGFDGLLYEVDVSSAGIKGTFRADGSPLLLYPGKTHDFYFLMENNHSPYSDAEVRRTITVQMFYRTRRLTL